MYFDLANSFRSFIVLTQNARIYIWKLPHFKIKSIDPTPHTLWNLNLKVFIFVPSPSVKLKLKCQPDQLQINGLICFFLSLTMKLFAKIITSFTTIMLTTQSITHFPFHSTYFWLSMFVCFRLRDGNSLSGDPGPTNENFLWQIYKGYRDASCALFACSDNADMTNSSNKDS